MKKLIIGSLVFSSLFSYFYKNSKNFRKSILTTLTAATIGASGIFFPSTANAKEVDAFTSQLPQHNRPNKGRNFFKGQQSPSESDKSQPSNNGADNSDNWDGQLPKCPKPESLEISRSRVERMEQRVARLQQQQSNSDSQEAQSQSKSNPGERGVKKGPEGDPSGNAGGGETSESINSPLPKSEELKFVERAHYTSDKKNKNKEECDLDEQELNDRQSETKNQTEDEDVQNSSLTRARKSITYVEDDSLTPEGQFVHQSQLTSDGRYLLKVTKDRRVAPLLQSKYENSEEKFHPAYSPKQLTKKDKHTLELLKKLNKDVEEYNALSDNEKRGFDLDVVEDLLAHPESELHMNVMGQGREPIAVVVNRGQGNYPIVNHVATFERRPEISQYNPYITNYALSPIQMEKFQNSNGTSIPYDDLVGNSQINVGPVLGKEFTSAPTVNDIDIQPDL